MQVVIANPGEAPVITEIVNSLEAKQAVVGGWIELWAVDGSAHFICNEEGRLNGMPFNRLVTLRDGTVWDIYGPILIVGGDPDEGTFESLPDEEARYWQQQLA